MTPLYAGIGGVVRELTEMYTGVDGVVKPMTEMWAGVGGVNRQIFSSGLPIGSVVQINESGSPQNYILVHKGVPSSLYDSSCNGMWLLRKDIINLRVWNSTRYNVYSQSSIHNWLQSSMLSLYDKSIKQAIKNVKIPYCAGGGDATVYSGSNGLDCKVFLLSGYEAGYTILDSSKIPEDGFKLSYFEYGETESAKSKRIATYNGDVYWFWLRSPYLDGGTYYAFNVNGIGELGASLTIDDLGVRPCIILPQDFVF